MIFVQPRIHFVQLSVSVLNFIARQKTMFWLDKTKKLTAKHNQQLLKNLGLITFNIPTGLTHKTSEVVSDPHRHQNQMTNYMTVCLTRDQLENNFFPPPPIIIIDMNEWMRILYTAHITWCLMAVSLWDRPPHREHRPLLFPTSAWVL